MAIGSLVKCSVCTILFSMNTLLLLFNYTENIPDIFTYNLLILNLIWFIFPENYLEVVLSNATVVLTDSVELRLLYSMFFALSILFVDSRSLIHDYNNFVKEKNTSIRELEQLQKGASLTALINENNLRRFFKLDNLVRVSKTRIYEEIKLEEIVNYDEYLFLINKDYKLNQVQLDNLKKLLTLRRYCLSKLYNDPDFQIECD